jgi:hypothetical protein
MRCRAMVGAGAAGGGYVREGRVALATHGMGLQGEQEH